MMGTRGQKGGQAGDVHESQEWLGFAGRMNGVQGRTKLRHGPAVVLNYFHNAVIIISTIVI